jgi:hypothetical protein
MYYIDKIDYDSSQHATIINTGGLADTTMANQPSNFVFFNKNTKYQEGTNQITIYSASKWLSFDQIFIFNPFRFTYQDTNYDLIGAKVRINDLDFHIIDTSWHGVTQVMNIYLQEQ